jgi:hypothetical protein
VQQLVLNRENCRHMGTSYNFTGRGIPIPKSKMHKPPKISTKNILNLLISVHSPTTNSNTQLTTGCYGRGGTGRSKTLETLEIEGDKRGV